MGITICGNDLRGAVFSECGRYRYALWRIWDNAAPLPPSFIGLNPSTADEQQDDPTIRRCIGYAKAWGFGGVVMLNLFALRSTDPANLRGPIEPVGSENDTHLMDYTTFDRLIIACWGVHGKLSGRSDRVEHMLRSSGRRLNHLGLTKDGFPKHPLYLKKDIDPMSWD